MLFDIQYIPDTLRNLPQWVCWKVVDGDRKLPIKARGGSAAKSNDPETWCDFQTACDSATVMNCGIGFVFAADDGLVGVDLDECIDDRGNIAEWALLILSRFSTYSEISPSGRGVKLWCRGTIDRGRKITLEKRDGGQKSPGIEIYASGRFFTVTGHRWEGSDPVVVDAQDSLDWLIRKYWPEKPAIMPATAQRPRNGVNVTERAGRYLDCMPEAIEGQGGEKITFHAACVLVIGFGLSVEEAWPVIADWNLRKCLPPWDEKRLRRKLTEADKQPGERGRLLQSQWIDQPGIPVDLSEFLATFGDQSPVSDGDWYYKEEPEPELPDDVLFPPGFLGELIRHNLKTAWFQQPELALAGALALLATLTGGKIADQAGTRTNLYLLGLAPSRSGKEHARKINREVLLRAGCESLIGPEEIGSHAAIYSWLAQYPTMLFQLDEIGRKLATMQDAKKSPHLWNIISVWLKLWSSSDSMLKGDAYADLKKTKTLLYPHAVIYGTSVPENVWGNLTRENVSDGLLARFLVFEGRGYGELAANANRVDEPVPNELVNVALSWRELKTHSGNLGSLPDNSSPVRLQATPEAVERWQQHNHAVCERRRREDSTVAAVWSGTPEKTAKLALLFAASRWPGCDAPLPRIELDDMDRAVSLANHLTRLMLRKADRHIAGSETERSVQQVLEFIRQRGGSVTMSELTRRFRGVKSRERNDIVSTLVQAEQCIVETTQTGGRPRTSIRIVRDGFRLSAGTKVDETSP